MSMNCPYCTRRSVLRRFGEIWYPYTKDFGPVHICLACGAYVGCHKGTLKPLGRLADSELRRWRKKAHAAFDPLWQARMMRGMSKHLARTRGYKWLGDLMGLPPEQMHIGMLDVAQCQKVVELCTPYLTKLKSRSCNDT